MPTAGILSGGGDSPGINAAIRAVVRYGAQRGVSVLGFLEGWKGPLEDLVRPLRLEDVQGIHRIGGTIIGTSRTNPLKVEGGEERILATLKRHGVDFLVAMGGDDTLGVAHRLASRGVRIVGIPQTIDNDIATTDYSIGFASALEVVTEALDRLHTTAFSHRRVLILEVMGRDSGWLSLLGGVAGGADVILLPEEAFSIDAVEKRIRERQGSGRPFCTVIIAEGCRPAELEGQVLAESKVDAFGHARLGGIGQYLADELSARLDVPVRVTNLAYLQRGGSPTSFDRILATRFGIAAVDFALAGTFDVMTALQGLKVKPVPLEEALSCRRPVDPWLAGLADVLD
jgi:6-phosphofructokinase 1